MSNDALAAAPAGAAIGAPVTGTPRLAPVGRGGETAGTDASASAYRGGSGPPLLLLHGATMSWRDWEQVIPLLTANHRVFSPTLPGHRGAAQLWPGAGPVLTRMVDAVCQLLDEEGLDAPHVAGNSLGGLIGLELARRRRARSLVAFSPAGAWRRPGDLSRLAAMFRGARWMARSRSGHGILSSRSLRRVVFGTMSDNPSRLSDDQVRRIIADMAGCTVLDHFLDEMPAFPGFAQLHPAPCPITIAWPERDRTISLARHGKPMLRAVPKAEFVLLRRVGHVPMYDSPALVASVILGVTTRA